jgi:two-component system alkaline phosphatase synthesis response regulator PhoP
MVEKDNTPRILLVDDEEDILEFVSYNLQREGFRVYSARNGLEAIEMAGKVKPDLVILDVMMPEMDGIAACEEIRKLPCCKNVLIAFLTARGEDYSQIAGFEAGADDYITKPIRPKVLISRVKALLKRVGGIGADAAENDKIINIGDIVIDKERYILKIDGKELTLCLNPIKYLPATKFTRRCGETMSLWATAPSTCISGNYAKK